jgi:hypothetical protein
MHGECFERLASAGLGEVAGLLSGAFQLAAERGGKGLSKISSHTILVTTQKRLKGGEV